MDEKSDLVTDSPNILLTWKNHFSQVFNVQGVNDLRQTEIHTAEPLVLEQSAFEVEIAIEKLRSHKSPGMDQIPAELIKTEGRKIRSGIHKLKIIFGIRRNCLRSGRSQLVYLYKRRVIKKVVVIVEAYHFCQLHTKF
jgi:hypothetical protein